MIKMLLFSPLMCFLLFSGCRQEETVPETITIAKGDITLSIEPASGGRISSLTFQGQEVLKTSRDSLGLQWGSTTWTSPQSDWKWPPIATFDREPFTVTELREGVVLLESRQDPDTYLRMRKRISLGERSDVGITYWVTNEGPASTKVALWENTRIPYGGYLSFQADSLRGSLDTLPVTILDSIYYIHLDNRHAQPQKVFTDLKEVPVSYHYNGLAFRKYTSVKEFYRTAPGQAPLEIYLDPTAGFAEFELQGDYGLVLPGESANLRVRWEVGEIE